MDHIGYVTDDELRQKTSEPRGAQMSQLARRLMAAAIKRLKNNKVSGQDNIASEMMNVDIDAISSQLEIIIKELWEDESVPTE